MSPVVYRTLTTLCELVLALPIGTNLGLLHVLLALVSGQLLLTRGALFPALDGLGLAPAAVRRAWAALRGGDWAISHLLACWQTFVQRENRWQAHAHGGYRPLAVDTMAFFRPRLQGCATKHYRCNSEIVSTDVPLGCQGQSIEVRARLDWQAWVRRHGLAVQSGRWSIVPFKADDGGAEIGAE